MIREVTAVIKEATITRRWGFKMAIGRIYEDSKGRFEDGTVIHTSEIIRGPDKDGIIVTRNSSYRLEMAEAGKEDKDAIHIAFPS